jgi:hypothetical protein
MSNVSVNTQKVGTATIPETAICNECGQPFSQHDWQGGCPERFCCAKCGNVESDLVHDRDAAAAGNLPRGAYHPFASSLRCRYCDEPMERRITRNRYTRKPAPGDVCAACLKDDAIDYAGVEFIRGER